MMMMGLPAWRWAPLLLVVASMAGEAAGRFVVEKNSLRVTSPAGLRGVYECAIGNFGMPQYGGTMHGVVVYPKANKKACKSFDDFDLSFKPKPGGLPVFLLVDRGDCYFTTKGWNAQTAGAAAVLVADDRLEPLITMDSPESSGTDYIEKITVPSALVTKKFGDDLKKALENGDMVNVLLDWRESLPHPDERVEYEFWTNSNDECGAKCDMQMNFVRNFRGTAQVLEKRGYTQFTPHYITWYCPEAFVLSKQCRSQCINHGRYCAPDPEQDFNIGYDGKDVVLQNLIQICLFKVGNETRKPWVWWDYVHDFSIRCPMKEKKYTRECANGVIKSLGLDLERINKCVGDPEADEENPVLKAEQDAQIGQGSRGDVTILPTLVVNNKQYRGKLEKSAVLKAVCSGFEETTEPDVCLSQEIQTNECLESNGGCCSGPWAAALSWLLFLLLAVAVPAAAHFLLAFRASRRPFSAVVQVSLSAASAAGFLCLSSSFRRIGLRRLLYLDKLRTKSDHVRLNYTARLSFSFRLLASLVAPCFAAEAAYKVWWYATSGDRVPFFGNDVLSNVLACSVEMASWMYRSAIYLLTCVLFRLICHLQGLRLEDFAGTLLVEVEEGRTGVERVLREHLDIRKQLKVISHRFRKFIVASLLIATASQFASVLLTTRHDSVDDLLNTSELALCSVVLMSGLIIILSSAAKITHQAQALTGQTTKWHACCTIEPVPDDEAEPGSNHNSMLEVEPVSDSEGESSEETGDEDLLENTKITLPQAHVISFQKRQALVTYLENNRAGITVFGFTLDRSYLHTIFMLEWTLFLWLLGKTIGFS